MIDDVEAFVHVAQILHDRGAYKIYIVATHGLLSADAPRHIEDSHIDEVSDLSSNLKLYRFAVHRTPFKINKSVLSLWALLWRVSCLKLVFVRLQCSTVAL